MRIGHSKRFVVRNKKTESLYSLIADREYRNASLGRNTWKKLDEANQMKFVTANVNNLELEQSSESSDEGLTLQTLALPALHDGPFT